MIAFNTKVVYRTDLAYASLSERLPTVFAILSKQAQDTTRDGSIFHN
jgi:hypothetical protein